MSKKHYVDDFEDMEDPAYELLGNRFSKLAKDGNGRDRQRERRAGGRYENGQDYYAPAPKVRRTRDKLT